MPWDVAVRGHVFCQPNVLEGGTGQYLLDRVLGISGIAAERPRRGTARAPSPAMALHSVL